MLGDGDDSIEEVDDDDIDNNGKYQRVAPFPSLSIKLISHLQGLSNKIFLIHNFFGENIEQCRCKQKMKNNFQ